MNPLLEQKYRYIVFEPVGTVRSQLKSILRTPWYDMAINLAGKLYEDNTFKLYPKFSLGVEVFGVVQNAAMITGRLEPKGEQTNIYLEVRPNYAVLLAFYLILLIFVFEVFNLFNSSSERDWILVLGLFLLLIFIRSLIHFSMGRLKNRFERTISVHPED